MVGARPTGTVSFLFTDIVGSTPLWDAHPAEMREALARHDEILRKAITAADGHVFSTGGDGFGAVFSRAGNAVVAAVEAQRSLANEPWPEPVVINVRIGVHTGEVQERDGDYFGPPVNHAARLMGAANGGQIVVSALTAGLLDSSVGVELVDLGTTQLKGIVEPVAVLGVTAPGVAWIDTPLISAQTSPGNLPRPHTEFVGDLADLQRRVSNLPDARLVTLTGSGGVGKTRASIEVGWLVIDEFVDGVWLVELASIADPGAVDSAIGTTLGARPQPEMTLSEAIIDWCGDRRMLLILDNCEHVLRPVLDFVRALTTACPTVTVLATSREPLGVPGEQVIRIPSLEPTYGAELFTMRATAADQDFAPSAADVEAITAICERVDGIPLAIELAAARIRSLSPTELLERLDDRFRLLRGGGHGGLERHQTLRAAVTWSYQLLSPAEQLLFDRLSVFAGGFDLAAAEAVCADDQIDDLDVVDLVAELVDKSMVVADRTESGTRYRLLETLRQYGEERLDDRGETAERRTAHLAYYSDLAERLLLVWASPQQRIATATYDREWDNFRAAHSWAVTTHDGERAAAIVWYTLEHAVWRLRDEHEEWALRTLELGNDGGPHRSRIAMPLCVWAFLHDDRARAQEIVERALAADPDDEGRRYLEAMAVYAYAADGQIERAAHYVPAVTDTAMSDGSIDLRLFAAQALSDVSVTTDHALEALTLYTSIAEELGGEIHLARTAVASASHKTYSVAPPDTDGAIADARRAIELADAIDATETVINSRVNLAGALTLGDRPEALDALRDALVAAFDGRYGMMVSQALELCAFHLAGTTDLDGAATLLGHVGLERAGWTTGEHFRSRTESLVAELDTLDACLQSGAAMDRRQAVAYALQRLDD
jgi:predicted ATPase/class 3 adenylate cyclase